MLFSPLMQMGIRILNYHEIWLILARSEWELITHRSLLLSHLQRLGFGQSFFASQRVGGLSGDNNRLCSDEIMHYVRMLPIQWLAQSCRPGTSFFPKDFQRMLCLMVAASSAISLRLLNMQPLQYWPSILGLVVPWKSSRLFQPDVPLEITK